MMVQIGYLLFSVGICLTPVSLLVPNHWHIKRLPIGGLVFGIGFAMGISSFFVFAYSALQATT